MYLLIQLRDVSESGLYVFGTVCDSDERNNQKRLISIRTEQGGFFSHQFICSCS